MRRAFLCLLGLVLLLPLALWAALQTPLPGKLAAWLVPGLVIEGVKPGLPAHFAATRVTYADARGVWLTIDQPELRLSLGGLLSGRLVATRLAAEAVTIARWPESTAPASPSRPFTLPRLPLAVELREIALPRLILPEVPLSLAGSATLDASVLEARLDLRQLDGAGRAALDARFDGTRLRATLDADAPDGRLLGAPSTARLRLDGPASGADWQLEARYGEASTALAGTVARVAAATRLTAAGTLTVAALVPEALRPLLDGARLDTTLRFTDAGALSLEAARLEAPAGSLTLSGAVLPALALDVTAQLPAASRFEGLLPVGLAWSGLDAEGRLMGDTVLDARLRPQGFTTGVAVADALLGPMPVLGLRLVPALTASRVTLEGAALRALIEGDLGAMLNTRGEVEVTALPGQVEGEARLAFTARGPRSDPALTLALTAPRLVARGVTAEALDIQAEVTNPATAPQGTARGSGQVMGLPLRLDLAAQPEGSAGRITRGLLEYGPAKLNVQGLLDPDAPRATGELRLDVPDLAPFSDLAGQPLAGRLTAEATGDSAAEWRIALAAPSVTVAGQQARASLTLTGQGARTRLTLEAANTAGRLQLAGTTILATPLVADVQAFSLEAQGESLRLAAPLRLTVDGQNYTVENLNLTTGQGGRLTGGLTVMGETQALAGRLAFTGLPLGLARLAAPELPLRGAFAGDIRLGGTVAVPEAALTLRGQGLGTDTPELRRLPPASLTATAQLRGTAIEGRANLTAGTALRLDLVLRRLDTDSVAATLTGEGDAAVLTAPLLAGSADRLSGRIGVSLQAQGSLAAPQLSGVATLRGLNYANADTGLRLDGINGRLVGRGDRLTLEGVAARTPDGGTVTLAGSLSPLAEGVPVDLTLTARRAAFASPDLGRVVLNADLTLRGALRGQGRLAGTITVTGGELRVPDNLPRSVPVLLPFREVGRTPPGRRPPRPPPSNNRRERPPEAANLALAVRVEVPGPLYLRGRGLDADLVGRLNIGGTLLEPDIQGDLRTRRGVFEVLGRRLELTRGIVKFDQGGVIPSLDVQATARAGSTTVTIGLTGLATAPEVVLSSNPPLPQDEVIAQLLFGRGTSQLSPFEIIQIAQGLGQIAGVEPPGGGVEGLLGRARRFLGLGGDGPSTSQTGSYVAPGVYLGLQPSAEGGTGLGIQAEIAPRLKLEGSAGLTGQRLGLTYEYEW